MMSYESVKSAADHVSSPMGPKWAVGLAVLHAMYNADRAAQRTVSVIFNAITPTNNTHDIDAVDSVIRGYVSSGDFTCVPMGGTPMYAMTAELRAAIDLEIELSKTKVLAIIEHPVVIFGMKYDWVAAEKINTQIKNYLSLYDDGLISTRPAGLKIGKFFIDVERLKALSIPLDRYLNNK